MLSDNEALDLSDTYKLGELILWPDREEARRHFSERTLAWWGEYFGHPHHPEKGYCTACGRGGSCIFAVFAEGIEMAVIEALGKTDRLMGLPYEECAKVDEDQPHGEHVHNPREEHGSQVWARCDGRPTFVYWTEPWEKGLVIHILSSAMDKELGTTQTHDDHPQTALDMAKSWLALTLGCKETEFECHVITPFWRDQLDLGQSPEEPPLETT